MVRIAMISISKEYMEDVMEAHTPWDKMQ